MRKIIYYTICLLIIGVQGQAQRKVSNLSDSYDRNGMTVIAITHGDSYDQEIVNAVKRASKLDKYDLNDIGIYECRVGYSRQADKDKISARETEIRNLVQKNDYGKKILSYIYNRKPDGTLDHSLVSQRGRYNATDEDYQLAQARKLGESVLADYGFNLIQNSYLMLIDFTNIQKETDKDGKVTYNSKVEAFLYKIKYNEETNAQVFECWIYDDDTPEVKAAKKAIYDQLPIQMERKTYVTPSATGKTVAALAQSGCNGAFFDLETKVEDLMVKMAVSNVRPLRAKIGKKEGLRNTDRYFAYRYTEDVAGNLFAVRAGVVRATKVSDNRYAASGDTNPSEFFQISGGRIEEGYTLVQKNDLGIGLTVGYHYGGLNGLDIKLDYLAAINTQGISHYVLFDLNMDFYKPADYWAKELKMTSKEVEEAGIPTGMTAINAMLGYGLGVRFARHFEVVPRVLIGLDNLSIDSEDESKDDDETFMKKSAFMGKVGANLNINLTAFMQLVVGADCSFFLGKGEIYEETYKIIKPEDSKYSYRGRDGLGINAGLRFTF